MNPAPDLTAHKLAGLLDLANLVAIALVILLAGAALTATVATLRTAFPGIAAGLDEASGRRSRVRRLLIGLLNGPALFLLAVAFGSRAGTKPVGVLLFLALLSLGLLGLGAELPRLGRSLFRSAGRSGSPLGHTLAGGAALTVAFLVPFLGWALFAGVLLIGIGSAVSWIFTPRGRTVPS